MLGADRAWKVVDTSLVVKWILAERHRPEAMALLRQWERVYTRPIAPSWFACEVGNAFYRRYVRGEISLSSAQQAVGDILRIVELRDIAPPIVQRALEYAARFSQPAAYDSQFLALAEALGCELWTADERFWNTVRSSLPWVRWVGEVRLQ